MIIYRFSAAVALVLEIAERSGLQWTGIPIGGGSLAQLGAIFGTAFVVTEVLESAERFVLAMRSGLCRLVGGGRSFIKELATLVRGKE